MLSNLAMIQRALGDAAGARPLMERALAITEANYGPDHPEVANMLSNLAMILSDLGDAAAAQPLAERTSDHQRGHGLVQGHREAGHEDQ